MSNTKLNTNIKYWKHKYDSLEIIHKDSTAIWVDNGTFEELEWQYLQYNSDTLYHQMNNDIPFRIFCKKAWNDRNN